MRRGATATPSVGPASTSCVGGGRREGVSVALASATSRGAHTESGDGGRPAKSNRRLMNRKSGKFVTDLQQVPGVGPRNEALLLSKGLDSQSKLSEVLVESCKNDKERLTEYLNGEIGIFHKHHCLSIADHIANHVEELENGEKENASTRKKSEKKMTFCIEGARPRSEHGCTHGPQHLCVFERPYCSRSNVQRFLD